MSAIAEVPSWVVLESSLRNSASAAPTIIVLDVYSPTCGPCVALAKRLPDIAARFSAARFLKVDMTRVPAVAERFQIRAVPTIIVFKRGQLVESVVGTDLARIAAAVGRHVGA